ncbi:MAG: Gfo/Idh/MocA family oxidoreductase [Acidobacteriota bacterium]
MSRRKINIGLLGVGRLGRIYARYLSTVISHSRLIGVADKDAELAKQVADELDIEHSYAEPLALLDERQVDAVVIATPTHTHRELVEAAIAREKAVFCEKPLSLSLDESLAMKQTVERSGAFFQMGFMRRFDRGYMAAKQKIEQGLIGRPLLFRATSRDPYPPSSQYLDPKSSGGLMIDMGIHDFDLALWLMGEIKTVMTIGGVLVLPYLKDIGDIDNAIVSLTFEDGRLGVVDLSRNGVYGYDILTEILGTEGTLRVGYLRETPLLVMRKNNIAHDTVPFFEERFGEAYVRQLQNFVDNLLNDRSPPVSVVDGIKALEVGVAATRSYQSGQAVEVKSVAAG